jgi:hypothetical protein
MAMSNSNRKETLTLEAAWSAYEAAVTKGRAELEATNRFRNNPECRATAYHALVEAQAMAYTFAIAPRLDAPQIHSQAWFSYFYTLGGTSPDLRNGVLILDGKRTYKVRGRFGGLKLILMQVFSHLLGHPRSKMLTNVDFSTLDLEPDGAFECTLSANRQSKNWIPLDPDSDFNFIFLRRIYDDWYCDRGELDIVAVGDPILQNDLDEGTMARRLEAAAYFLDFLISQWTIGIYDLYLSKNDGHKNRVCTVPGKTIATDFIGSPSTDYFFGVFEIAADEALIIECEKPQAGYWSMQVMDVWCKPYDFVHRQTDVNMSRIFIDRDGRCRYVVSVTDPGFANWLDPAGRREGIITGRNYHSKSVPASPTTKRVELADLRKHLPADTSYVTPQQRSAALEYRTRGYAKMYGY